MFYRNVPDFILLTMISYGVKSPKNTRLVSDEIVQVHFFKTNTRIVATKTTIINISILQLTHDMMIYVAFFKFVVVRRIPPSWR